MSRTIDEVMEILGNNYTPEELVDLLDISSSEICLEFENNIREKIDSINELICEDLGETDDEDY